MKRYVASLPPGEMARRQRKSGPESNNYKHGLYPLKQQIKGLKAHDSTDLGITLRRIRQDFIADFGGAEISNKKLALIDLAARNKLLVDSIDQWLFEQPSLIIKKYRRLLPVVLERQQLANGLAHYLTALGLERESKQVNLHDYVQQKYGQQDDKGDG